MSDQRTHPFDLVFAGLADERFGAISRELGNERRRDAFLLARPAVELMYELRPEDGIGDGIGDYVGFVHAAYLFWQDGRQTVEFDETATRLLCAPQSARVDSRGGGSALPSSRVGGAMYIQIAPRLVWGQLADGDNFEPLDGWFGWWEGSVLHTVACFGVHPGRPGLSVLALAGHAPRDIGRDDGTAIFTPTMPGGDAAGLHAVAGPEELLLLACRAERVLEER